jgi:Concanavalin A-like lectin/glucanases superfamily
MSLPTSIHPFLITGNDANQYKVPYSLRFRSSNSQYLGRTPTVAGDRKTWTFSCWLKRGTLTSTPRTGIFERYVSGTNFAILAFNDSNNIFFYSYADGSDWGFIASPSFRDPAAWYHVVAVLDTTKATAADRMILYVNNVRLSVVTDYGNPTQYLSLGWNAPANHTIGRYQDVGHYSDFYLTEVNFIDGQALTPSSFGETDAITNQWKPKKYQGLEFIPYTATSGMVSQSGLQSFSAATVVADADNAALPGACFYTDSSGVGSYLQFDLGAGNAQEFRKVRVLSDRPSGQGAIAVWNIQYSDDASSWTTAYTSLDVQTNNANYGNTDVVPTLAIWGSVGSHRYWRLYKTNSATGGDYHRRITFYTARMSDTPDYGLNGFYLPFTNLSTQTFGNLINYSQNFENGVWTKDRSSVGTNYLMAPDGTPTADKLIEDTTASNTHRTYINNMTLTNGVTYCFSVYAKAGERSAFALEAWNGSTANYCYADLSTGTVISGSHASAVVTSVGNGWYRCSVTLSGAGLGGSGSAFYLMNAAVAGSFSYTGNGSSGIYFWGAQIEASTAGVPGPYRSTSGSATSTFYPVSADSSRDRYSVSNNYNNFDSYGTVISGAPTTATTTHDSYIDSPTSYDDGSNIYNRGNYPTLRILRPAVSGHTYSNGNLTFSSNNSGSYTILADGQFPSTGKYYFEIKFSAINAAGYYAIVGVGNKSYTSDGVTGGASWNTTNTIGIAIDCDNSTFQGYKDGVAQTLQTGATVQNSEPYFSIIGSTSTFAFDVNFGQRPFSYTPPAGFKALNSFNLPSPSLPLV